ncbi:sensor histidine kinase [Nocardioides nanhaiensis]|uniref:Signal transduction histidine kinase subgroup 3 dimerisation and phosphoacceptor domain-containing protein n=1 Tax=Nocardioides nanhaiensis TaxID=1476871 RepID=A0ABP8VZB9_9ACTN
MTETERRGLLVALSLAAAVVIAGLLEAMTSWGWEYGSDSKLLLVLVVLGTATAVGVARRWPGWSLALVWLMFLGQLVTGTPFLLSQVALVVVAFSAARWGSTVVVALSGVSIPMAVAVAAAGAYRAYPLQTGLSDYAAVLDLARGFPTGLLAGATLLGLALLGVPWALGLAFRFRDRARASKVSQERAEQDAARQRELADQQRSVAEQQREIADLREAQGRLARDVHDVVGHSLAVILAQAESAQYLPDDDPERLKATLATIAGSARESLQDVRAVLSAGSQPVPVGELDDLVTGVRAGGRDVRSSDVGTPRPLPPELAAVAYRVQQEMLTNAVKHGSRESPVLLERHWDGELRLEVRNVVADAELTAPLAAASESGGGQGLDGMRRRLESVGGRLDVRRREEDGGTTFTVTAWMPVSGR